jgi:hypothetical protein
MWLSEKKKNSLEKGKISSTVRDAISKHSNEKKAKEALKKLKEIQHKYPVKTTTEEIVKLIREDRDSH